MWGEIEEPVKTQPIVIEEEKGGGKFDLPVRAETSYRKYALDEPIDPRQQRPEAPVRAAAALTWTATTYSCLLLFPLVFLDSV